MKLYIGVDGGATKAIVRVEDAQGNVLGRASGGPANIRISVGQTWESILCALDQILRNCDINIQNAELHSAMGLAGCEIESAYKQFVSSPNPFHTLKVTSDAHIACVGAHGGADGAIIVAGTGVVGFQVLNNAVTKVSGWGFPHDDIGGGAWLGLEAVKISLQYLDGRLPESALAKSVYQHFKQDHKQLVAWANQANSTAYAELAPLVIRDAQAGDPAAIQLLRQAAEALHSVHRALGSRLPLVLIGGIAPHLQPYLEPSMQACLVPCKMTPDAGAALLAREMKHG